MVTKVKIIRRTFQAKNSPKYSFDRGLLNSCAETSEYYPSKQYAVVEGYGQSRRVDCFRTKKEAEERAKQYA